MNIDKRIGVIMPWAAGYLDAVVRGIGETVHARGCWSLRIAGAFDEWIPRMLAWKPDGVIANVTNQDIQQTMRRLEVPTVNISAGLADSGFPTVHVDDRAVGATAAAHLLDLNLKRFAYWGGHDAHFTVERREGFFGELRLRGVDESRLHTLTPPVSRNWRRRDEAIRTWMTSLPKPVGLLASHDAQAYYLADLAREAGLDIPNEIALMGVDDDSLMCEVAYPSLSSVSLPGREVGHQAADLLAHLLDGGEEPAAPILLDPIGVAARGSTDMLAIDDPDIVKAVRYIRNRAVEGIAVADVLKQITMARRTFEWQFRSQFGRSPGAEIRRVQIAHARRMLIDSDASIAEVARRSGFCDARYLARVFRRETGQTPSQFRKRWGGR